jgi:hypothetical protein
LNLESSLTVLQGQFCIVMNMNTDKKSANFLSVAAGWIRSDKFYNAARPIPRFILLASTSTLVIDKLSYADARSMLSQLSPCAWSAGCRCMTLGKLRCGLKQERNAIND